MSNFLSWQSDKVHRRRGYVMDAIVRFRKYKSKFSSISDMAAVIAEEVTAKELDLKLGKGIDSSTLLRRAGPYRTLLDAFFMEINYSSYSSGGGYSSTDPVANRIILANKVEISELTHKLELLGVELQRLRSKLVVYESQSKQITNQSSDSAIDSMAGVVKLLFDLLLQTDYFTFDSELSSVVMVGRSRRVVVSSNELAPYLNYVRK